MDRERMSERAREKRRKRERDRERLDAIGGFPAAHRSFPYAERPPHRVDRHPRRRGIKPLPPVQRT